jgi:eukaryotic-like serine/threonine-protein kinase
LIAGRYTIGREIGRGGMGAVWLGRDDVLGRDVALKRIGMVPGASAPDLERAEREARLAARLNHPHVVAVYDLVDDGADHWLVMEYVEGVTLAALIKRDGALTPDEAGGLVRQAADALAAAHAAGIVHRDVKPSNMLVNSDGEVKISDFGIARAEADASLTQTGLVTGSPAYLAPEVASGSTATEAADVWSLGATLFHALSGHPPYDVGENLMGALYRIVHEEPPRLPDAGWLTPLLEHTMTREPGERWSMAQVRDFLDQGHDVTIHPAPLLLADDDEGTRVLQPTPAEPMAVPPVAAEPRPGSPPAGVPAGPRGRSPLWPWAAAVVVLVAVGVIAFAALNSGNGGGGGSPGAGGPTSSAPGDQSSSTDTPQVTAMRDFVSTYLATVTSDQHTTWAMLTPGFQQESGGFGSYQRFWRSVSSATPSNISADPTALTVSYDVAYVKRTGSHVSDHRTLQLVRSGTSYLIAGES